MFIRERAGSVMVSEAGKLTVWSNDHPDAGKFGVTAASEEFLFETWGARSASQCGDSGTVSNRVGTFGYSIAPGQP
jgi:hypothetical protein